MTGCLGLISDQLPTIWLESNVLIEKKARGYYEKVTYGYMDRNQYLAVRQKGERFGMLRPMWGPAVTRPFIAMHKGLCDLRASGSTIAASERFRSLC